MAGFKSDPMGFVQQIANDLKDRYRSGFPIIKEMLQNADDSKAEKLLIGWHEGIYTARHPLLKYPAMFFVNDAPLSLKDVDGITSIGLGTKADNISAVGKFGLGMKSLFHFGEVFFFMAHDWRGAHQKADVLSPWDDTRQEWNQFDNGDKELLESVIHTLNDGQFINAFFVVWVPLRSTASMQKKSGGVYASIIQSEDYGNKPPEFLSDNRLQQSISHVLPMLKQLNDISAVVVRNGSTEQLFKIRVDEGSQRRFYPNPDSHQEHILQGAVVGSVETLKFAGLEKQYQDSKFNSLRSNQFWPHSFKRSDDGDELQIPDKSRPQSAVVVLAQKVFQNATLTIRWAVFLPLGDQDTAQTEQTYRQQIEGEYSFEIMLHGQFFIDAGRVGIHGVRLIGQSHTNTIDNEEKLCQEWNRLLANEGTLPLFTQAIAEAITQFKLAHDDVTFLLNGIDGYLTKRAGYADKITSRYQLVSSLATGKPEWKLIDAKGITRPIPQPKAQDFERVWDLFPDFRTENYTLIDADSPSLINNTASSWTKNELDHLIANVDVKWFESTKHLEYFNDFLNRLSIDIQDSLMQLMRRVFVSLPLPKMSSNTSLIQRLIQKIQHHKRYAIKLDKKEQALWDVMHRVKYEVLIISDFLDPPEHKSSGMMQGEEVEQILQHLDKSNLDTDLIDSLTQQLLASLSKQDREDILRKNDFLKVFTAYQVGSRKKHRVSRYELNVLYNNGRLFSFAKPNDFGIAEYLLKALRDKDILFINSDINKTLFGSEAKPCDSASIINLLKRKPLLDDMRYRVDLVNKLDLDDIPNADNDSLLAVRYLLHANRFDTSLLNNLWLMANAPRVWVKLHTEMLGEDDQWTVLSYEVSDQIKLTAHEKSRLKISEQSIAVIKAEVLSCIDAIDFANVISSQDDAEDILCEIDDEELWKKLPLHLTEEGSFVSIDDRCYFKSELVLPFELSNAARWIRRARRREVQKMQEICIERLSEKAAIQLALESLSAHQFERDILTWLNVLDDASFADLKDTLSKTKWLIDPIKRPIAPIQILDLDDNKWREANRLWGSQGFLTLSEIKQYKDLSEAFDHLCLNTDKKDQLVLSLVNQAKGSKDYGLGRLNLNDEVLRQATSCQSVLDGLPGWLLVIEIIRNIPETPINAFDALIKDALHHNLMDSYNKLINKFANKYAELRLGLITTVLAQTTDIHELADMKFFTQSNQFKPLRQLAYGIEGADPDFLLNQEDYNKLTNHFHISVQWQSNESADSPSANTIASEKTVTVLEKYCKQLATQVDDVLMIASTIVLMIGTPGVEKVFNLYRSSRTAEGLLDIVGNDWKKDFMKDASQNIRGIFFGKSLIEAVQSMTFSLAIINTNQIKTQSLLGQEVTIPLSKNMRTIFVDDNLSYANQKHLRVFIRPIPRHLEPDDVSRILKNSAEYLLREVYEQPIKLDQLWESFHKVEQVDIEVAKLTMEDNLEAKLRELKIKDRDPAIADLLQQYESALNRSAESGQSMDQSDRVRLIRCMWHEIESRDDLQAITLQAGREKIKQAQYHTNSIPFEIFQNADDACVELIELGGELTNDQKVFRVIEANDSLTFCNWGRQINQYAITSDKSFGEQRGFKRDLQKMIALHQSDKREEVTGKFGLGFKSCLLASDSPHIVSGKLVAQIKGGILPIVSEKIDELAALASHNSVAGKKPTIIYLPLAQHIKNCCVMKSFRENAAILPVFAKSITAIELGDKDSFIWEPTKKLTLSDHFEIERGQIQLVKDEKRTTVDVMKLSFESDVGCIHLLFQLGKNGIIFLDDSIKRLWNLAPLSDDIKIGFAINANFEVDIGRNQLAIDSHHNEAIFTLIGQELASFFSVVYNGGMDSLVSVFTDTSLDNEFWSGVWQTLTQNFDPDDNLVSNMFHAEKGLLSFFSHYAVVPTKLPLSSASRALVCMNAVKFMASKLLSKRAVIQHLDALPTLKALRDNGLIVANDVGSTMQKMLGADHRLVEKSVDELFSDMLEESGQNTYLSPKNAMVLESFYNDELMELIRSNKDDFYESYAVDHVFEQTLIKVKNGSYRWLSEVLFSDAASVDEQLVIGFVPDEHLLSPEYNPTAIALLKRIRRGTPYSSEDLFEWIKRHDVATNDSKQRAIVRYILEAIFSDSLVERIKQDRAPNWLFDLKPRIFTKWEFSPAQWISWENKFQSEAEKEREYHERYSAQVASPQAPDDALLRVFNWWLTEGKEKYLQRYERKLKPTSLDFELLHRDELGDQCKKAWLKLFYLGACQTIGRVTDDQNRSAIEYFEQKGWWDVFVKTDNPQEWFDVLNQYLDDSQGEESYRQWLQILPLYRFSKYFEDYVELFASAEYGIEHLSDITTPARSSLLAGSGISYPTIKATLGSGINFILRELRRQGFYENSSLDQHCYVLSRQVREFLKTDLQIEETEDIEQLSSRLDWSKSFYDLLVINLGEDKATFDGDFDIPFRVLANETGLLHQVLYAN